MTNRVMRVNLGLLLGLSLLSTSALGQGSEPTWTFSGSWVRNVFFFGDLYRVNLSFGDLEANLREYLKNPHLGGCEGDQISRYLLDPEHRIPVKVQYDVLSSRNSYSRERDSLVGSLNQIGYTFQKGDDWTLTTHVEDQDDVLAYVDAMIGRNSRRLAIAHEFRKDGDTIYLQVGPTERGAYEATLTYTPHAKNKRARKAIQGDLVEATSGEPVNKVVIFKEPQLLLGIISTFSSSEFAKADFKKDIPPAVMKGALELCRKIKSDPR
ncbi:MAG: hypothetical protein AB7F66_00800 [Bacteriovoracia bacterium]